MSEFEFNPMLVPKVEKEYTGQFIDANIGSEEFSEEPIPEFKATKPPLGDAGDSGGGTPPPTGNEGIPPQQEGDDVPQHFAQMSASEKRRNAEKTADLFLVNYQRLMPVPFIMISSYNPRKVKKLHDKGEINLNMVVRPSDGTTIGSHIESYNEKVMNAFEIDDGMLEELKEPLVEVLMEKGVVPSPMARLGIAVGGHVIKMSQVAFKLYQEKQDDMEQFKRFRAEEIEAIRRGSHRGGANNSQVNNEPPQTPPHPSGDNANTPPPTEEKIPTETQPSEENTTVNEEIVVPPFMENEQESVDLADYLNSGNDDSVVIEEVAEEVE